MYRLSEYRMSILRGRFDLQYHYQCSQLHRMYYMLSRNTRVDSMFYNHEQSVYSLYRRDQL